jgi:hypothetical protein
VLQRGSQETIASLGNKEKIIAEIECLMRKLAGADILPDIGYVTYYTKLDSTTAALILPHEAGHVIYRREGINWPPFTPLSIYSLTSHSKEEDFCENFSFFMNGYLVFKLLSFVSEEWSRKLSIIGQYAQPYTYVPNLSPIVSYLIQHLVVLASMRSAFIKNIAEKIVPAPDKNTAGTTKITDKLEKSAYILKLIKFLNPFSSDALAHMAYTKSLRKAIKEKRLNLEMHRKIIARLCEKDMPKVTSEIRYKGKRLEEYGLNPQMIDIINRLGVIPDSIKDCLDTDLGNLVSIFLQKYFQVIITPNGIYEEFIPDTTHSNHLKKARARTDLKDFVPLSARVIQDSINASRLSEAERQIYYDRFQARFGIELQGSKDRSFSYAQVEFLSRIFEDLPPALLKYFKKIVRTHSSSNLKHTTSLNAGIIALDDVQMAQIYMPRHQLKFYLLSTIAVSTCSQLIATKNQAFLDFLHSGGWEKTNKSISIKLVVKVRKLPEEYFYTTSLPRDHFLVHGYKNAPLDFSAFLVFVVTYPDILKEICDRTPNIKSRLTIFEKVLETM